MDAVIIIVGAIGGIFVAYLIRNGIRNADPMNRKCAAEICQYIAFNCAEDGEDFNELKVFEIFQQNARYRKQGLHVVSMVPALLIKAGHPKDASMALAQPLIMIAAALPE